MDGTSGSGQNMQGPGPGQPEMPGDTFQPIMRGSLEGPLFIQLLKRSHPRRVKFSILRAEMFRARDCLDPGK